MDCVDSTGQQRQQDSRDNACEERAPPRNRRGALMDLWASVDLTADGFTASPVPCMLRLPGDAAPPRPDGLEIVEVGHEGTCRDLFTVLAGGFGIPDSDGSSSWSLAAFGDARFRAWVGYVESQPVSAAAATAAPG